MGRDVQVGNMSFEVTEPEIRRLFSVAGTVSSVHMVEDPQTGQFKGFAYVRMSKPEEAADAVASLDGALFEGRIITVKEAKPSGPKAGQQPGAGRPEKQGLRSHAKPRSEQGRTGGQSRKPGSSDKPAPHGGKKPGRRRP